MKGGNRSKAGRKRDGIGEKSEIRANAGIRMKDENEREQKYGNGRKRISAATGMSINFHQLTQTVLSIPKLKHPARSCASLTAGAEYLHPPAYTSGISHFELQTPAPKFHKPYGRGGMPVSAGLCRRSNHKKTNMA